jgi:predicted FMN-binding regulatory protein PaiB
VVSSAGPRRAAAYPPSQYVEGDREKIYAIIERFNFATVISARDGEPFVTHVPVTLNRSRGAMGVLFGHMDRRNPHARLIDGRSITVLFHGPNSYISPHVLETDVLPTWNSINVHARGTGRLIPDQETLILGLCGISEKSDPEPGAYRLNAADPRIDGLIDHIVGFEIEITELVGRFKVSQELDERNRELAALEMAKTARRSQRPFLARMFELELPEPERGAGLDLLPTAS